MYRKWIHSIFITGLSLIFGLVCPGYATANDHAREFNGDEVFLSFRYQVVTNQIVTGMYNYETGEMLLSVNELFDILSINYTVNRDGHVISGFYLKPDNTYEIRFSEQVIKISGREITFEDHQAIVDELGFFLSPELFEEAFELDFTVNLSQLNLSLRTPHTMPVIQEHERQMRRSRIREISGVREYHPLKYGRDRKVFGGGFLDYTLTASGTPTRQLYRASGTFGSELLGGDFQGNISGSHTEEYQTYQIRNVRWRYVLEDQNWLTHIFAGQLITTGFMNRQFTGVRLTNSPLTQRRMFENYVIDGYTEPNAEVEIYDNNRLIGYMEADESGFYRFEVPLTYGNSLYRIVIYNKNGERIELERRAQVPFSFLPAGELTWRLDAGRLDRESYFSSIPGYFVQPEVGFGISSRITVRAGAELREYEGVYDHQLFSSVYYRPFRNHVMGVDWVDGRYVRINTNSVFANNKNLRLSYSEFFGAGPNNIQGFQRNFSGSLHFPFSVLNVPFGVRLRSDHNVLPVGWSNRYHAELSTRLGRVMVRAGYRDGMHSSRLNRHSQREITTSARMTVSRAGSLPSFMAGSFIRGQMVYNPDKNTVTSMDFSFSRSIRRIVRVQAGYSRNFEFDQNSLHIGVSLDMNTFRSNSSFRAASGGYYTNQTIRGSMVFDGSDQGIYLHNQDQVGNAGVTVRLFLDNNNSGTFDEGDELLDFDNAVRITGAVGGSSVSREGKTRLFRLRQYSRYNLEINKAAIRNPMLVPAFESFSFIADPNRLKTIDVPFYMSGIIEGRVVRQRDDATSGIRGVRLLLRDSGGELVKTLRTFSDGSFYSMEIRPGKYTLEIDPEQLSYLGSESLPGVLEFEVQAIKEGDYLENLDFKIREIAENQ